MDALFAYLKLHTHTPVKSEAICLRYPRQECIGSWWEFVVSFKINQTISLQSISWIANIFNVSTNLVFHFAGIYQKNSKNPVHCSKSVLPWGTAKLEDEK